MLPAIPIQQRALPTPLVTGTPTATLTLAAGRSNIDSTTAQSEPGEAQPPDTVETRLWLEEHQWLHALLRSDTNVAPTFRMPDLVSACVSLVFLQAGAPARIFAVLGTQMVLRSPLTPRRRESLWRAQYDLLLTVQRSAANRHPHPKFQLDQLTTACVALCQAMPGAEGLVLRQSRLNMAERASRIRLACLG